MVHTINWNKKTILLMIFCLGLLASVFNAESQNKIGRVDVINKLATTRDLSGMDLRWLDLSGIDLSNAILKKVRFDYSNLTGANLSNSDLTNARFCPTNLTNANLKGADLRGAIMPDSTLAGADLAGANFSGMLNLLGVDFTGANLAGADFTGANMEGVRNLDKALNADKAKGLKLK